MWNEFIKSLREEDLISNKLSLLQNGCILLVNITWFLKFSDFSYQFQGEGSIAYAVYITWYICFPVATISACQQGAY